MELLVYKPSKKSPVARILLSSAIQCKIKARDNLKINKQNIKKDNEI